MVTVDDADCLDPALAMALIRGLAGRSDGQVLVVHDMLGINQEFSPRFLRHYARLHDIMKGAFETYIADVKSAAFPSADESY